MSDGYSFKSAPLRPVRGLAEFVDKSYPNTNYEYVKLGVRANVPTLEARSGIDESLLAIRAAPSVYGDLSVIAEDLSTTFSVERATGVVSLGRVVPRSRTGVDGPTNLILDPIGYFVVPPITDPAGTLIPPPPPLLSNLGTQLIIKNEDDQATQAPGLVVAAGKTALFVCTGMGAWVKIAEQA